MGVEHIAVVLHHSTLSGTAKLVLVGIANHAGDGGAWPSIATLARYAGCSERTVQRCIGEAVAAGELSVTVQGGGSAGVRADRRPNRYDVLVSCGPECGGGPWHRPVEAPVGGGAAVVELVGAGGQRGDAGVIPSSERGDAGVIPSSERGDTGDANGVTLVSPETSFETSFTSPSCNAEASHGETGAAVEVEQLGFAEFWAAWPGRRAHKRRAEFEWRRALTRAGGAEVILAGVQRLAADPHLPADRRMVPLPAAWLAGDCWLDDGHLPAAGSRPAGPRVVVPPPFDPSSHGAPGGGVGVPEHLRAALMLTSGGEVE